MALERINPDGMYKPNKGIYSQVVKSTSTTTVHVAGTVSFDEDANVVGVGDMKAQVLQILDNIKTSLAAGGASPSDVVRINVYTLDTDDCSTTVQVSKLVHPDWIVEIEATAVID